MDITTVERQKLIEAIGNLSDEALFELANFLDYLHCKSVQQKVPSNSSANFLVAIAGLGKSGQEDISEHDEEILSNEAGVVSPAQSGLHTLLSDVKAIQAEVPTEEWDKLPHDSSINHGNYLY